MSLFIFRQRVTVLLSADTTVRLRVMLALIEVHSVADFMSDMGHVD